MKGPFGKDARDNATGAQADRDRLPVNSIKAVFGKILAQIEIRGAFKYFISLLDRADVIDGEGNDLVPVMIEADELERGAVGIKVDAVRLDLPFGRGRAREGVVVENNAAAFDGRLCQAIDGRRIGCEVLCRKGR